MGGKPFTVHTLIERGRAIHRDRYDYSRVKFTNRLDKVEILCPDHGSFWQTPAMHTHSTKPTGCPVCGEEKLKAPKKGEQFTDSDLEKLVSVHGNRYRYDRDIIRKNGVIHVRVHCPSHGEYVANYRSHLNGAGCRSCWRESREIAVETPDELSRYMRETHGTEARYAWVSKTHVGLLCPHHGEQPLWKHPHKTRNTQCRECISERASKQHVIDRDSLLGEFDHTHAGTYEYPELREDITNQSIIQIQCSKHGRFEQRVKRHRAGQGCPRCAGKGITTQEWIAKAQEVHGSLYDYSEVSYSRSDSPVVIGCSKHGPFEQAANNHLSGSGCPRCKTSRGENQIAEILDGLGIEYHRNDRSMLRDGDGFRELDFYIPEHGIAIEYHGLFWHTEGWGGKSRRYHLDKLNRCESVGIRLIQIFQDELHNTPDLVRRRLSTILSKTPRGAGGRQLTIRPIDWAQARSFLDLNHLQGAGSSGGINYGAFHDDTLVGVLGVGKSRRCMGRGDVAGEYEIIRFASDQMHHPGMFSKLLKHFCANHSPTRIVTYADRRWSSGDLYHKTGFEFSHNTAPGYWYTDRAGIKRIHRFSMRKSRLRKRLDDHDGMTEYDMAKALGHDRVWDCGSSCWIMELDGSRLVMPGWICRGTETIGKAPV